MNGLCPGSPRFEAAFAVLRKNFDLVSNLRRLLPGKETRSAEENLERPKTDASGIYSGAAESQLRGTWLRGCVLSI